MYAADTQTHTHTHRGVDGERFMGLGHVAHKRGQVPYSCIGV